MEVVEVLFCPDRLDAEHRRLMGNGRDALSGHSPYSLRGAVSGDQLGESFFNRDQLALEFVVFCIRNNRRIEDVISVVVSIDLTMQVRGAPARHRSA